MNWLESLYYCFRLSPYSKNVVRGLKKEGKYYLYDWSEIGDPGARFENCVASHLRKSIDFWNDTGAGNFDLFYVRDQQKREVDFLIVRDKKPWMLVEAKLNDSNISGSLRHMASLLGTPHNVLVNRTDASGRFAVFRDKKFWVTGAPSFLLSFV